MFLGRALKILSVPWPKQCLYSEIYMLLVLQDDSREMKDQTAQEGQKCYIS